MAYFFTPPLIQDRPAYLPDSTQDQKDLWTHYENRWRGVNVWILTDGTVVQDTATAENSNTDMTQVYPWDVNNSAAPYVRAIYIDVGANPQIPSEHDTAHSNPPVANFYGGATWPITNAQETILANYTAHGIGYADCITSH